MMKKKIVLLILSLTIPILLLAPERKTIPIIVSEPVNPYEKIAAVIREIESGGNDLAYNFIEDAAGPYQIRICKLEAFNKETGCHYKPEDRFNFAISHKILMYYITKHRPDDILGICIEWNGVSKENKYFLKVQKKLLKL